MALPGNLATLTPRMMLLTAATAAVIGFIGFIGFRVIAESTVEKDKGGATPGLAADIDRNHAFPLVRHGGSIFVPEHSSYRSRIVVAPAQQKNISLSRVVTGTVEADPARTVKVLAPVTGRVGELDVELGDTVKKGQPLATLDSGDLAQAVADAEKARASAKLTKSAFDRATGLNKAGG